VLAQCLMDVVVFGAGTRQTTALCHNPQHPKYTSAAHEKLKFY